MMDKVTIGLLLAAMGGALYGTDGAIAGGVFGIIISIIADKVLGTPHPRDDDDPHQQS